MGIVFTGLGEQQERERLRLERIAELDEGLAQERERQRQARVAEVEENLARGKRRYQERLAAAVADVEAVEKSAVELRERMGEACDDRVVNAIADIGLEQVRAGFALLKRAATEKDAISYNDM